MRPRPILVDFDDSPRAVRIGCRLVIEAVAMDATNASNYRPSHNTDYLQIFDWKFYRQRLHAPGAAAAPVLGGSSEVQWEELPLHFPGVDVAEPVANEYRGRSAQLQWVAHRGQEGRHYRACVTVRL